MFNYKGLVLATSAFLFVSGSAFALSDSIRADHDYNFNVMVTKDLTFERDYTGFDYKNQQ